MADQLTPNQVVAYNLRCARELRGWTQEEAASRLERHVGKRWSLATWSAAERSVTGDRVRQFDADELVAFAQTFDLPPSWFLTPPAGVPRDRRGGPTSELTRTATPSGDLDYLEGLRLLLPDDAKPMAEEVARRAVLQVEGETDGERIRQAWAVVRDHLVSWIRTLGLDPSVAPDSAAMRRALDAAEALERHGDRGPEVPAHDDEEGEDS